MSLTAFSGLNSSFHSGNQKTIKLELRYSYLSLAKKSITYYGAMYSGAKVSYKPEDDLNQALLTYNSSLKTKFSHLSSETLLFNIRSKFSGKQPVHQYPDEDTFPSI